jgi:16S rRNA (cytidine1402-2'-O)-methyltransferase
VLVSTPIGNLGDLTPRAREGLLAADVILCEDTRHTARLLSAIGAKVKLQPLHEHNEDAAIPGVLAQLRQGRRIVLVSDAGVPLVSDPGYRLVRAALAEDLPVGAVPGANAAVTALVLSGLPPLPFTVLGFPPPRQAARRAAFGRLRAAERAGLAATLIWYEAPHRLAETLADMAEAFGARGAAVARERTMRPMWRAARSPLWWRRRSRRIPRIWTDACAGRSPATASRTPPPSSPQRPACHASWCMRGHWR